MRADFSMARFIQLVRSRLAAQQQQFAEHPDADLLAAFAEQSLSAAERAGIVPHLARCADCREILALSAIASDTPAIPAEIPQRLGRRRWRWPVLAAVSAAVPLLVVLVLLPRMVSHHDTIQSPEKPVAVKAQKAAPSPQSPSVESQAVRRALPPPIPPPTAPVITAKKLPNVLSLPEVLPSPAPKATDQVSSRQSHDVFLSSGAAPALNTVSRGFLAASVPVAAAKSLWTLDQPAASQTALSSTLSSGTIFRSIDGGRTWLPVHVGDSMRLTALWANGPEIWVGGEGGALFHSANDGLAWSRIAVTNDGAPLTATITAIDSPAAGVLKLRIQNTSDTWVTVDGGAHWVTP
jgi:hypothetical protein